ncbi:related to flavin-containing monooxygenase [Fusarium torulosum]|uniref:Related to flavin-containing monooxygenase n=1 Tax=Fusarium torulosum TaxID=33205 RepID=A0AAE8M0Q0_9HYPO|nr:related to flavin-containing monooxygenase [Fusarium torulosum]
MTAEDWDDGSIQSGSKVKSVAVIGAGASGTAAAVAFKSEDYFDTIKVFERREAPGGTWLYDDNPPVPLLVEPGALPTKLDRPLEIPEKLPQTLPHNRQERFQSTPIYESLTTSVPEIAMSFSDKRFGQGPFVPHSVPRKYLQDYYSFRQMEDLLILNTTVEDLSKVSSEDGQDRWRLTLRKYDAKRDVDEWWQEVFDAVVIANGQFSIPYIPDVEGLGDYMQKYPGRVSHSKTYRRPNPYKDKNILIVGNSLSGRDITEELTKVARWPVYISRRHKSRWEGSQPDEGTEWKPVIKKFVAKTGQILFDDGSSLDDIDHIIYCTGYKPSFPFWNAKANGQQLYDYDEVKLNRSYLHTFFRDYPTLGIIGLGQSLAFRSYEYQAIALARVFAGSNATSLPSLTKQKEWEKSWEEYAAREMVEFHTVPFENGELLRWYTQLSNIAGIPFCGKGKVPPAFTDETLWQLHNIRRLDEPGNGIIGYKQRSEE